MAAKPILRTPLTPSQLDDAERLKHLYKHTPHQLSQADFGAKFDIGSQSAVWQYLNGKTALNIKAAYAFAEGLKCSVSDFSPTLASQIDSLTQATTTEDDDFALVQRVDVCVSAGHGALVFEEGSKSGLRFRRSFLQEIGVRPASAVVVTAKGSSMEPTIRDGAVLLVSTTARTVVNREIYAFRCDGHLYVKRLHRHGDAYLATSDNPDREAFPDMKLSESNPDLEIIGRALWMGAKL